MDEQNVFYVYVLFRPWNGQPCYVGKGHGSRWRSHFAKHRENHPNVHLANIIAKAKRLSLEIPGVIVRAKMSEVDAFALEIILISAIGRSDKRNGPLVNMTDGGDGTRGFHKTHSDASKKLMSIKVKAHRASLTPEERSAMAHKVAASQTPEQHSARTRKGRAALTKEQVFNLGKNLTKNMTTETRFRISSAGGKTHSSAHLSAIGKKGGTSMTSQQKSIAAKKGWSNLSKEQRTEITKRSAATRITNQQTAKLAR